MKSSDVPIPEPCAAGWDDMSGDERRRHCALCQQDVHDLSAMTEAEAHTVLDQPDVCVRYTVGAQDRILFKSRRRFLARAVLAAGAALSLPAAASVQREPGETGLLDWAWAALDEWWSGSAQTATVTGQTPSPPPASVHDTAASPPAEPPQAAPEPEPERREVVMGRLPIRRPRKLQGKPVHPRSVED